MILTHHFPCYVHYLYFLVVHELSTLLFIMQIKIVEFISDIVRASKSLKPLFSYLWLQALTWALSQKTKQGSIAKNDLKRASQWCCTWWGTCGDATWACARAWTWQTMMDKLQVGFETMQVGLKLCNFGLDCLHNDLTQRVASPHMQLWIWSFT